METISTVEEQLPSLLLSLPDALINDSPAGDGERYRSSYLGLVAMGGKIELPRLRALRDTLADGHVAFTRHESDIGNIQDWWFGTRRVEGDTYMVVLHGLVSAYINALADLTRQPHHLCRGRLDTVYDGLSQMAQVSYEFLYGEPVPAESLPGHLPVARKYGKLLAAETILHPMYRWRAGHQLFFVAIQSLNMLFTMVREAVKKEDWRAADRYLRQAAYFMDMSARSIEYASHYDSAQYETQVRPLMPPGFSGLMLADHTLLIKLLKKLRKSLFASPPEALVEAVDVFLQAMGQCYDAHNLICETFVNQGPSLRDINSAKNSPPPAVEMLDKMKEKRQVMLSRR